MTEQYMYGDSAASATDNPSNSEIDAIKDEIALLQELTDRTEAEEARLNTLVAQLPIACREFDDKERPRRKHK